MRQKGQIALVLSSYKDMNADGVKYLTLSPGTDIEGLLLSAMWHQGNNNHYVSALPDMLADNLEALTREYCFRLLSGINDWSR